MSEVHQPEVKPFHSQYAVTLANFYYQVSLLLKREDAADYVGKATVQECEKSTYY